MDDYRRITTIQREFFAILDEFFQRATGGEATEFATFDSFDAKIRGDAPRLARKMPDAYSYAGEALSAFYGSYGSWGQSRPC